MQLTQVSTKFCFWLLYLAITIICGLSPPHNTLGGVFWLLDTFDSFSFVPIISQHGYGYRIRTSPVGSPSRRCTKARPQSIGCHGRADSHLVCDCCYTTIRSSWFDQVHGPRGLDHPGFIGMDITGYIKEQRIRFLTMVAFSCPGVCYCLSWICCWWYVGFGPILSESTYTDIHRRDKLRPWGTRS